VLDRLDPVPVDALLPRANAGNEKASTDTAMSRYFIFIVSLGRHGGVSAAPGGAIAMLQLPRFLF
jgi:hypothetical protein